MMKLLMALSIKEQEIIQAALVRHLSALAEVKCMVEQDELEVYELEMTKASNLLERFRGA